MAQRADVLPAAQVVRGGLIASLVYAVGFFGQWFGGHAGSRARPERLYALLLAATAGLLAASFFASGWPLVLILAAFSFVHFSTQPMDNVFTGKYTSLGRRGLGYGVSFALSFGFGSFAAWSGGAVVDAAGGQLRYISLLLCGAAVLATVCAWRSRRSPRASEGEQRAAPPQAAVSALGDDRRHDRLLGVQAVLGLVEDHGLRRVEHLFGDLLAPVRRQAVHDFHLRPGQPRAGPCSPDSPRSAFRRTSCSASWPMLVKVSV